MVVELQARLRNLQGYLSPSITEAWLRRYQVFLITLYCYRYVNRHLPDTSWSDTSYDGHVWLGWIHTPRNQDVGSSCHDSALLLNAL